MHRMRNADPQRNTVPRPPAHRESDQAQGEGERVGGEYPPPPHKGDGAPAPPAPPANTPIL
jgi:hypothetical protein